jgi:hypothetical protein
MTYTDTSDTTADSTAANRPRLLGFAKGRATKSVVEMSAEDFLDMRTKCMGTRRKHHHL